MGRRAVDVLLGWASLAAAALAATVSCSDGGRRSPSSTEATGAPDSAVTAEGSAGHSNEAPAADPERDRLVRTAVGLACLALAEGSGRDLESAGREWLHTNGYTLDTWVAAAVASDTATAERIREGIRACPAPFTASP